MTKAETIFILVGYSFLHKQVFEKLYITRSEAKVRECSERRFRRTRPKVREGAQSRSASAKCCESYASLHDRFCFEVRILFYPMRTWKLAAWVTLIITDMRVVGGAGEGLQVEGGAGIRGAAPAGGSNLKCVMKKFCHEMRHDLWR